MSIIFELTTLDVNNCYTGTWYYNAHSQGTNFVASSEGLVTASWPGPANSFGMDASIAGQLPKTLTTGTWGGATDTWGVQNIVTESHERFQNTNDDFPVTNQGIGPGEWNAFPNPEIPPPPDLP